METEIFTQTEKCLVYRDLQRKAGGREKEKNNNPKTDQYNVK